MEGTTLVKDNSAMVWSDRSSEIDKIALALSKFQSELEAVKKDSKNPFFNSKYADLASVWDVIRDPLAANGLAVLQEPSSNGNRIVVTTTLIHTSGQYFRSCLELPVVKQDPQGFGSAITYGRRYGLQSITGVAPEDDDGNAASVKPAEKLSPRQQIDRASPPPAKSNALTNGNKLENDRMPDWYENGVDSAQTEWLYALPYDGCEEEKAKLKEAGGGYDKARKIFFAPKPIPGLESFLV